jgi:hypothetical protein
MATGRLNAARTEAENVKTAALAYYADLGAWPVSAANDLAAPSRGYLSGTLVGTYAFGGNGKILGSSTYDTYGFTFDNTTAETWKK